MVSATLILTMVTAVSQGRLTVCSRDKDNLVFIAELTLHDKRQRKCATDFMDMFVKYYKEKE